MWRPRPKSSLWPFCRYIPGPTMAIWASLKELKIQWIRYFAGSTGWLDTSKKSMKWKVGESYARAMAGFPRILFGRERDNLRYARLGLIKWLMCSPRKTLRGKLLIRYQGLTLRFAVNVDFSFLNKYLD